MTRVSIVSVLFVLASCAAPTGTEAGSAPLAQAPHSAEHQAVPELSEPPAPTPWTDAFLASSVLVANRILVEGPPGLFEHVVARGDDQLYRRKVETLATGRRQIVQARRGGRPSEVVRAQLDAWQLAAYEEVIFFENVDPGVPVTVQAIGDAVWRDTDGHEMREPRLDFRGEVSSDL